MADLSRTVTTEAKRAPGRAWLGEVSAVVLQQSLRDLDAAYRNFFAGLRGDRARVGPPRLKSRKDARQAVRFTANARWSITPTGRLRLPKIGDIRVRWSRALPSAPSSVTIIKDAAGRIFASFVVETTETSLPETGAEVGIDLGLAHFAVLSDGTKHTSPRLLRRAEKKLKKLQKELSRKRKGSSNRVKARLKVARQHAKVADARREFHHSPPGSSARIKRLRWRTWRSVDSSVPGWRSRSTMLAGPVSSACSSTRLGFTAGCSLVSADSNRPARSARPAESRTGPSPSTSAPGPALPAEPSLIGT